MCAVITWLELAYSLGLRRIILESNLLLVVHLITKNIVKVDANYALINKVKAILEREWEVKRQHIFREATVVAEWLANFGLTKSPLNRDYGIIDDPFMGLFLILYYDLIGSTLP